MSKDKQSARSLGRRAVTGGAWVSVETVSVQAISLLIFAVMAHYLEPHTFGLAAICYVLANGCKAVFCDSFAVVVARQADGSDADYSTAFWITVVASVIAYVGLQLFSLTADKIFDADGTGTILRAMSLILLVQGVTRTQEVWLQRHFMYRTLALRSVCGAVAGGIAGVCCAVLGFGVWSIVVQQLVTSLGAFALLWSTCPWRPTFTFSRSTGREILSFSWRMSGGSLAYAFNQNCDTLLIGLFFGPASVGFYSVAKRLRLALQLTAAAPVNIVAGPALAEVQNDPARFTQVLLTAISVVFSLCGPAFLGAAVVGRDAIAILFGEQWIPAAPIFSWLAMGGLLALVVDYNNTVFIIRDKPSWTLYLASLNVLATLAGFMIFRSERTDLMAVPFVLPFLLQVPISMMLLKRVTGIPLGRWFKAVLPPLAAAGLMVLILRVADPWLALLPATVRLVIMVCSGAIIYAAVLAMLSRALVMKAIRLIVHRR